MSKNEMSVLDAFLALDEIEDVQIDTRLNESKNKKRTRLTEGKGFNVRDVNEMEKAENFLESQENKEVALEVIDVDADSLEHLKNNEEYVGQMILQCNSCKANRFINAEDLVESEADNDIYNVEDECPHCHGTGTGFHLIGQVGKIAEEEPEVENDSLTDEVKFDNDLEEQPEVEEPAEEQPEEEVSEEEAEEIEDNGMETNAEDDTADMESTLGDEFNSDDVAYDDTEEAPEEKAEDSLTQEDNVDDDFTFVEEPEEEEKKKEKKESLENESLEEDVNFENETLYELSENIIEPENIKLVCIYDLDSDNPDEEVYKGSFEDMPESFLDCEVAEFNVSNGMFIINIDSESEIDELTPNVKNALSLFGDDFNENISVWDQASGEEVFVGTKQSVIEEFGHNAFLSFEAPEELDVFVRNMDIQESLKTPYNESLNLADPTDKLIFDIIEANGLKENRLENYGTDEYWLADSIKNLEDLDIIYKNYVENKSEKLVLEFKDVTGFGLDEALCEAVDNEDDARKEAEEALKKGDAEAVIYGYITNGKFKRVKGELLILHSDRELGLATELIKAKYKPTGSIRVLYKNDIEESLEFRNRKELKEAILDCDSKGISYQIKRSTKEGYRYTLLKESPIHMDLDLVDDEEEDVEDNAEVEEPEQNGTLEGLQNKLEETANTIALAIAEKYSVDVNESAILNDMVNDLCLGLRMEDLGERSIEDFLADLSQEEINAALNELEKSDFSEETIKAKVAHPAFAAAIRAGQVPGVTPREGTEPEDEEETIDTTESLDEAKKDDELPADPDVVKTNVHATLNDLVTDEIEAINGYEEAKAEIADTHIEHKDDIIDTIDHIEDEEEEHIDELIDAASEIPFDKEEAPAPVAEEPVVEEPAVENDDLARELESLKEDTDDNRKSLEDIIKAASDKKLIDTYFYLEGSSLRKKWKSALDILKAEIISRGLGKGIFRDSDLVKKEEPAVEEEPVEESFNIEVTDDGKNSIIINGIKCVGFEPGEHLVIGNVIAKNKDFLDNHNIVEIRSNIDEDGHVLALIDNEGESHKAFINNVSDNDKIIIDESVDIHIEDNNVTIKDDSGEDVAIIPVEPEGEEASEEKNEEETELEVKEPEEDNFDEKKFESFINEWLDNNVEDTRLFETTNGFITEDGTIILEGVMHLEEGKEEETSFTLTPNKKLNEQLLDSKKVTTYTITSKALPEGLICRLDESWIGLETMWVEDWLAKYQKATNCSWEDILNNLDELALKCHNDRADLIPDEEEREKVKNYESGIAFTKGVIKGSAEEAKNGTRFPKEFPVINDVK